jgi:hypothetical protein
MRYKIYKTSDKNIYFIDDTIKDVAYKIEKGAYGKEDVFHF